MGSLKGCVAQYADIGPEPAPNRLRVGIPYLEVELGA
jgi:hypothetical protein